MEKFQAESEKLLDMMIHSVYTNQEIFLRELLSNASDALDKRYYLSLHHEEITLGDEELRILLTPDVKQRTLTISDNGVGMTKEELTANLGTIAKSGSLDFRKVNESDEIDIIGQFGVGFYSAFMVAERVKVISRSIQEDQAWQWESTGVEGFTITPVEKTGYGTDIILYLREDTENNCYTDYLEEWRLAEMVKKYSDYIRYPIQMLRHKRRPLPLPEDAPQDAQPEYETYTELETLNSMTPLWKRGKGEVTEEEYNAFYKTRFNDYADPARVITCQAEGKVTYTALLYLPDHAPFDYYTPDYEKGLALYSSGVLIMERCPDLLPDWFSFVKGVVDSEDLSLNLSREMLQQDHQMKLIAASLEKKIKSELLTMLRNDREKYEAFFRDFGRQLKFGVYSDYGIHQELLQDLLMFWSAKEKKMVTLEEYVSAMGEGQKWIYYAAGDKTDRLEKLPAAQLVLDKGFDVLLCSDDIDEFTLKSMHRYGEKEFRNVTSGDLGLESEEEKKAAQETAEQNKALIEAMQTALAGKVSKVAISSMLKDYPACLSSSGAISLEMEKVLKHMPGSEGVISEKVLELNANHPVFGALQAAQAAGEQEKLSLYADLLYQQALLMEGLPLEDPAAFAQAVCQLMK